MNNFGLDLAVIGNGRTAALVDPSSRIVWWCYPRFDSNPIFSRLVAGDEEKGFSDVVLDGMADYSSEYTRNTAVVSTVLTDREGGSVRITDFAPRFRAFDRLFRPPQLFRIIEPVAGLPRITIRFRPTYQYGIPMPSKTLGSNHITFRGADTVVRLTTDAPLSYIRPRGSVRPDPAGLSGDGTRRAVSGRSGENLPRICGPDPRLLDRVGAPPFDRLRLAGRHHSFRDHAQAQQFRGDRRDHRRAYDVDPRSLRTPGVRGITVSAGCAMPISSSRL